MTALPAERGVHAAGAPAETLQLIAGWLAAGPATLAPSLLAYIGHPAYGLGALRNDLTASPFSSAAATASSSSAKTRPDPQPPAPEFPTDIPLASAAVVGRPELRADLCLGTYEPNAPLV